jgi:hypothetical protein
MIQFKVTKHYIRIVVEIFFGFVKPKEPSVFLLNGSLTVDPRKINIDYLLNRTIWPMNVIYQTYDTIFEKELDHDKTMKIILDGLEKRQKEATKDELLAVEKQITFRSITLA